jgi:hypothetical protein
MRLLTPLSFFALILACAGGKDKGGDGVSQDPACADYLDCLSAADPATFATVQSTYGPDGSCWTDAASADSCATACETGLSDAAAAYPDEAACDDGGPPTAADLEGDWTFTYVSGEGECTDDGIFVQIDSLEQGFSAEDDTNFSSIGIVILLVQDQDYNFELMLDCHVTDSGFACDEYTSAQDVHWTLSGTVSGGEMDATMEIGLGDGDGNVLCTDTEILTATR